MECRDLEEIQMVFVPGQERFAGIGRWKHHRSSLARHPERPQPWLERRGGKGQISSGWRHRFGDVNIENSGREDGEGNCQGRPAMAHGAMAPEQQLPALLQLIERGIAPEVVARILNLIQAKDVGTNTLDNVEDVLGENPFA